MNKHHPTHLYDEWHTDNPQPLSEFSKGSHFRALWVCRTCGHEWRTAISNRTRTRPKGSGCPQCVRKGLQGKGNPSFTGHEGISGLHWLCINREAQRRNIPVEVSIQDVWELFLGQGGRCALSGRLLTTWGKRNGKKSGTASLDRIDSSNGYVKGNLQWIDKEFQQIKRDLPDQHFITLCREITEYQNNLSKPPSFVEWRRNRDSATASQ